VNKNENYCHLIYLELKNEHPVYFKLSTNIVSNKTTEESNKHEFLYDFLHGFSLKLFFYIINQLPVLVRCLFQYFFPWIFDGRHLVFHQQQYVCFAQCLVQFLKLVQKARQGQVLCFLFDFLVHFANRNLLAYKNTTIK
jgi:hypothetical protein